MEQRTFKFRKLMIIVLALTGFLPAFIGTRAVAIMSRNTSVRELTANIQKQALILSDKITRGGYLRSRSDALDSEMDLVADIYNGRIMVINRSMKVVRDTFNNLDGKYAIYPEVVLCFKGENTSKYNGDNSYLVQTFPIYNASDNQVIDGVLLITSSTQSTESFEEELSRTVILVMGIVLLCCVAAAFWMTKGLIWPFDRLIESLHSVAQGSVRKAISRDEYDITKEIADDLNISIQRLEEIDKSRDEFVANVSHELKTPITSMRVLADSLLSMDAPIELYKEFMTDISHEIDREATIIDDLMNLIKMDSDSSKLKIENVDIVFLLKKVINRVLPIASQTNIAIDLEQCAPAVVQGDESQLMVAFSNLIENAVKYNVENGSVTVGVNADHENAYISVADTGLGIAPEYHNMIFERFFRVDKARSRERGGSGLGLAITKSIIVLHHGSIGVESEEGKGTIFTVTLPLKYEK